MNKSIQQLNNLGQSVWYDNLSKDVLESGELANLIQNSGISGLTSNPAIFKAAIAESSTYDDLIKELAKELDSPEAITDELMVRDVAAAADLLKPVYDKTNGSDGFASLEVSPLLANNTIATIESAKTFWNKLNRPNIMIKVPATEAGIPAIESLIADGINVNVTLIFSPGMYQKIITAYLAGIEKRLIAGEGISHVHSVASFFISRNDSWTEKYFTKNLESNPDIEKYKADLWGKVGIANALKAYSIFTNSFDAVKDKGINIQKILWASTGVKNPAFSSSHYALGLPFKNSVATHPPATLKHLMQTEFGDQLPVEVVQKAETVFETMQKCNLSAQTMYNELLEQGVSAFENAYLDLIKSVKEKC